MVGVAPNHSTKHTTRADARVPRRKFKSGFNGSRGEATVSRARARRSSNRCVVDRTSYRIIEPIHSREYAHLIDSYCCRSFIASATDCVPPLSLSLSLETFGYPLARFIASTFSSFFPRICCILVFVSFCIHSFSSFSFCISQRLRPPLSSIEIPFDFRRFILSVSFSLLFLSLHQGRRKRSFTKLTNRVW